MHFITDIINKSGHKSVTDDIEHYYPNITLEYIIKTKPDLILVCFESDMSKIQKLLPEVPIIFLTKQEQDIINRSGPRVYEAIKMFADLDFTNEPIR